MSLTKKELSIKKKLINLIGSRYMDFIKSHYSQQRRDSFRTLISVLLSQRTREELTLEKDGLLFDKLKLKLEDFLAMGRKDIEKLIFPVGFYRQKARRIKDICRILKEKHKGEVPETREELLQLPGIGKKSADVVLNSINGKVIAMDVHVGVVSKRLGLVDKKADYDSVQGKLHEMFSPKERKYVNLGLVLFGREICITRKPRCQLCPLTRECRYYNSARKKI